ncbi:hypothetical protein [Urbifossiella limnaea]|uniref:SPOR domain-containing protein n=1 Tax=Urbifossiella limnaea TaxID=2528023 RepID=A0A517XY78_9BACT|nr:hypothetical protein [Urbifossiella limnaea]QDU22464.1 hypothetical protein ETAA1_44440 [Urbifossiella limnaea]
MAITALVFAAAGLTVAGIVATRSGVHPALASQDTVVGLSDAASDTVADDRYATRPAEWQLTCVDDLSAAEDLLDCLEAHGFAERELVMTGNATFAVRWR